MNRSHTILFGMAIIVLVLALGVGVTMLRFPANIVVDRQGNEYVGLDHLLDPPREYPGFKKDEDEGFWRFVDGSGNIDRSRGFCAPSTFDEGRAPVWLPDPEEEEYLDACFGVREFPGFRVGYLDEDGTVIVSGVWEYWTPFASGLAFIRSAGKGYYIDRDGNKVIEIGDGWGTTFYDGRAIAELGNGDSVYAIIDKEGTILDTLSESHSLRHLNLVFAEGCVPIKYRDRLGYIRNTGEWQIPPQFEFGYAFNEGLAPVKVRGQWGYIDSDGEFIISPRYSLASPFRNGFGGVRRRVTLFEWFRLAIEGWGNALQ